MFHSIEIKEVLSSLNTSIKGLTSQQAQDRINEYGENKLEEEHTRSWWKILLSQFNEFIIYILLFAAAVSFAIDEVIDAYVILAILFFNAILGFIQEYKAERAIELLRKLTSLNSKVLRDGSWKEIPSSQLVPGDIILVETGDRVNADIRIFEAKNLETDEASLTGESTPVSKILAVLPESTDLGDRKNMLYAATSVVRGRGIGIVVSTGMQTEVGKIARLVQNVEEGLTPLQLHLRQLGKYFGYATLAVCIIVVIIGLLREISFLEMLLTGISLAVAAVPEGLPAVVTICLAVSVQQLVKRNALVKRLKSIETLGDVTTICSDKTGTLTKNEMTVNRLFVNNWIIEVTGTGYNTQGTFLYDGEEIDSKRFRLLLEIAASCNDATVDIGDPTERALMVTAAKAHVQKLQRKDEIPFDADKKFMATMHDSVVYYKGAPEVILEMCNSINIEGKLRRLTPRDREKILKINHEFAQQALRVLGMAYKRGNMIAFVGLMGMIDLPREGVSEAVSMCRKAGIRTIMITGDHAVTAMAIGKQIGIEGTAITGKELDSMTDLDLQEAAKHCNIFARTSSSHKVRILKALQASGEIVAMTGDGVNDAPALKGADVGVAMAIKGTDVARDAADMVLTDDHYASIVKAVELGRVVYDNIRKFVLYLLSANAAEIGVILVSLILNLPLPLLPIHILWMNLMTDSWPALALAVDTPASNPMEQKPRDPRRKFMAGMMPHILTTGIVGTLLVIVLFKMNLQNGVEHARTVALTSIIVFELLRVFSVKSTKSFHNLFTNKWIFVAVAFSFVLQLLIIYTPLEGFFRVQPLPAIEWTEIIIGSIAAFIFTELIKPFLSRNSSQETD